jgi:hypothetical protein
VGKFQIGALVCRTFEQHISSEYCVREFRTVAGVPAGVRLMTIESYTILVPATPDRAS